MVEDGHQGCIHLALHGDVSPRSTGGEGQRKAPGGPTLVQSRLEMENPLAIPEAFPGFSAAAVAEHSWVQREGLAGFSEAISTWQNLHPHLGV